MLIIFVLVGVALLIIGGLLFGALYLQRQMLQETINNLDYGLKVELQNKIDGLNHKLLQHRDDHQRQSSFLFDPLHRTLESIKNKIEEFEKNKLTRDLNLSSNVTSIVKNNDELLKVAEQLRKETHKMINIFKKPNVRGKWGENQLKRLAEITGMLPYCDFELQQDVDGYKPDMTVHLPNGGSVFVDSKAPMDAYLQLLEADGQELEKLRRENTKLIRNHIYSLSSKKYWEKALSPPLVIMFIPMEGLFLSAIEEDGDLLEYAASKNVIITTPMTFIGLLKTIFFGWGQINLTKEIENMRHLISITASHLQLLNKEVQLGISSSHSLTKSLFNMHKSIEEYNSQIVNIYHLGNQEIKNTQSRE